VRLNLPALTIKRLKWILEHVYSEQITPDGVVPDRDEPDLRLFRVIKSMQLYNLEKRTGECSDLFRLFSQPYFLEGNSEGTTRWLALALAIKELYALDDEQLQKLLCGAC
jgi:hypothetical protein